jgi:putative restriction endonuclease
VFLHRPDSIYDDHPETQYQFPKQYLGRAAPCARDWIVYYEPVKGGGKGYYAIARVERIIPDPSASGMYLALIEPGSYLPFERPVPLSGPEGYVESGLLNEAGKLSGRAQAAVRPISLEDFNRILELGIPEDDSLLPRVDMLTDASLGGVVKENHSPFLHDIERERVSYFSSRIIRDRIFRRIVLDAYDCRCAITGHRFINGGGRAETQAAHVKPVEAHGPDIITNGIALSGTAHWMFDRGLISLSDGLEVLVSRHVNDSESVWGLVNPSRRAIVPAHPAHRPHSSYLAWHRENIFKA